MRFWKRRALRPLVLAVVASAVWLVGAVAFGQSNPLNDLFALGQGSGDSPAAAPVRKPAAPSYAATPLASCGAGSRRQPGVDGRVPAASLTKGLNCNISLVGHQGT